MNYLLTILFLLLPALVSAQPAIQFTSEQHDFGVVIQGTPLEYSFEFSNTGSEELTIKDVITT